MKTLIFILITVFCLMALADEPTVITVVGEDFQTQSTIVVTTNSHSDGSKTTIVVTQDAETNDYKTTTITAPAGASDESN